MFKDMLKVHKNPSFTKINFIPADKKDESKGHKDFKKEMQFFVKKIKSQHKSQQEFDSRIDSCSNENMFNNLLELIEKPEDNEKMPVRKFFNNTFGTLLNDAIFNLRKKQEKSKSKEFLTMQGQVRYVAFFLQSHLPETEKDDSEEEGEESSDA